MGRRDVPGVQPPFAGWLARSSMSVALLFVNFGATSIQNAALQPTPKIQHLLNAARRKHDGQARLRALIDAMTTARASGDRYGEADGAFFAAKTEEALFRWADAIAYFDKAVSLYTAVGATMDAGVTLHEIGIAYDVSGDRQKAVEFFLRAQPVEEGAGDVMGRAATLLALSEVYDELGDRQKAMDSCTRALAIFHDVDPRREALALNYLGRVYEELGRRQDALTAYRKALPLFKEAHDDGGQAQTLTNIGLTYDNLGKQRAALEDYRRALPLWHGDLSGTGATLNDMGKARKELGDYKGALADYERALRVRREIGDREGEAITRNNIGRVYFELSQPKKALDDYALALPLERESGEREAEAITLRNCAYAIEKLGRTNFAIASAKQSVNLFQGLRSNLKGMGPEIQRSYAGEVEPAYRFLADLLISKGRLAEAQEVLDLLKDDEYFKFLRSVKAETVDLTPDEAKWKTQYDALGDELAKDASEYDDLAKLGKVQALSVDQIARKAQLDRRLGAARQAFQA